MKGNSHLLIFFKRYNGQIPNGDRGRRKSKFQLRQRTQANGLKAQRQHLCKNADEVQVTKIKLDTFYHQGHFIDLKLPVDMVIGKKKKR